MEKGPGETLKNNAGINLRMPTAFEQEVKAKAKEKGYTKTSYSICALEEKMYNDDIRLILREMTLLLKELIKHSHKKR